MADRAVTTAHSNLAAANPGERARLGTILHVQWALAHRLLVPGAVRQRVGRSERTRARSWWPVFSPPTSSSAGCRPRWRSAGCSASCSPPSTAPLIVASLYVAGQLSVELVLLCLGILILAIAGLRIGPIALATSGATRPSTWASSGSPATRRCGARACCCACRCCSRPRSSTPGWWSWAARPPPACRQSVKREA